MEYGSSKCSTGFEEMHDGSVHGPLDEERSATSFLGTPVRCTAHDSRNLLVFQGKWEGRT